MQGVPYVRNMAMYVVFLHVCIFTFLSYLNQSCQEPMIKDAEALPCGHSFHKKCVADWENQTQRLNCAVCK